MSKNWPNNATVVVGVTATDCGGRNTTVDVNIYPLAQAVEPIKNRVDEDTLVDSVNAKLSITTDDIITLETNVLPADASQALKWTSSNKSIATIAEDGTVTAYKAGTVTITATANDQSARRATFRLTITK